MVGLEFRSQFFVDPGARQTKIAIKVSHSQMVNETLIQNEINRLNMVSRVKPYAVSHLFRSGTAQ